MAKINTLTKTTTVEVATGVEAKSNSTGRRVTITESKRRPGSLVIKSYDKDGKKVSGLYLSHIEAEDFANAILDFVLQA